MLPPGEFNSMVPELLAVYSESDVMSAMSIVSVHHANNIIQRMPLMRCIRYVPKGSENFQRFLKLSLYLTVGSSFDQEFDSLSVQPQRRSDGRTC